MLPNLRSVCSTSRISALMRTFHASGRQSQAVDNSRPQPVATNPFTSSEFPAPPSPSIGSSSGGSNVSDPHGWWRMESQKRNGDTRIISKFHGRSLEIKRPAEFAQQYRALKRLINQTGLRKEVRLQEYYEKPSERRVRVASENHRKRFSAVVSFNGLRVSGMLMCAGQRKSQIGRALQEEAVNSLGLHDLIASVCRFHHAIPGSEKA